MAALIIYYLFPEILKRIGLVEGMCGSEHSMEGFDGEMGDGEMGEHQHGPECAKGCGVNSGSSEIEPETFSSCYRRKQIYLNSCDPDTPTGHADVNIEQRWGKLYINIQANLPYALGGVMNTMWGAYTAFLVDTKTNRSIDLGSLVRHGDRFYKLATELLGEYSNYNEIWVYRQTEDMAPKLILRGNIANQMCGSL